MQTKTKARAADRDSAVDRTDLIRSRARELERIDAILGRVVEQIREDVKAYKPEDGFKRIEVTFLVDGFKANQTRRYDGPIRRVVQKLD